MRDRHRQVAAGDGAHQLQHLLVAVQGAAVRGGHVLRGQAEHVQFAADLQRELLALVQRRAAGVGEQPAVVLRVAQAAVHRGGGEVGGVGRSGVGHSALTPAGAAAGAAVR